jgi:hypothetical protein
MENALAYINTGLIMAVKVDAHDIDRPNIFYSSSLTVQTNKLECLLMANFQSCVIVLVKARGLAYSEAPGINLEL